jgi:hypothetical protein
MMVNRRWNTEDGGVIKQKRKVRAWIPQAICGFILTSLIFGGVVLTFSLKHTPDDSVDITFGQEGFKTGIYFESPWCKSDRIRVKKTPQKLVVQNIFGNTKTGEYFIYKVVAITFKINNLDSYISAIQQHHGLEEFRNQLNFIALDELLKHTKDVDCVEENIKDFHFNPLPLDYLRVTKVENTPPMLMQNITAV